MARPKAEDVIPEKAIIEALMNNGGVVVLAARELGTTRQNLAQRIAASSVLQEMLQAIEGEHTDVAEGHMLNALRQGDMRVVLWYLERKGKKRGYGNSVQAGFDEAQLEAIVASFGGNLDLMRNALLQLGIDPEQTAQPSRLLPAPSLS